MNMVQICTVRSTSPLQQRYLVTRLGKLRKVYTWFNFKLRKCISVCISYTCGVNDCNEQKTEKWNECTNIDKLWTTWNMTAAVRHVTSGSWLKQFQSTLFLLDRVYLTTCPGCFFSNLPFVKHPIFQWYMRHAMVKASLQWHTKNNRMMAITNRVISNVWAAKP
jgi:hypothetical protein